MMPNYGTPAAGRRPRPGVRLWDADGREYLDFVGGIAVSALGHAHPAVVAAVQAQVGRLAHTSNLLIHEPGVRLAERLARAHRRATDASSSPTAAPRPTKCALKIVRKHSDRREIVAAHHSFHGRTLGTLAITGNAAQADAVRAAARPGYVCRLRRRRGPLGGGDRPDRRGLPGAGAGRGRRRPRTAGLPRRPREPPATPSARCS
jgi:acetylornithine/succinyldiaminopimelate/putrescine aminotransferase